MEVISERGPSQEYGTTTLSCGMNVHSCQLPNSHCTPQAGRGLGNLIQKLSHRLTAPTHSRQVTPKIFKSLCWDILVTCMGVCKRLMLTEMPPVDGCSPDTQWYLGDGTPFLALTCCELQIPNPTGQQARKRASRTAVPGNKRWAAEIPGYSGNRKSDNFG